VRGFLTTSVKIPPAFILSCLNNNSTDRLKARSAERIKISFKA
jgi:hypothetical protein